MWNDTDIPLAYLITFRCYGTWLHGDSRGSIDRNHNAYKSPYMPEKQVLKRFNTQELKTEPVTLNGKQRKAVESAIKEVCQQRIWYLWAINVRTNHVHIVVSTNGESPSKALNNFKAYATKRLKESNLWSKDHSPWSNKGSKRHLWNEQSIAIAVDYVINGQRSDLPEFV